MKRHVALLGILSCLGLSVLFNNCSPEHAGQMTDGFSVIQDVNFLPCSFKDESDLFDKTFHPFLMQNCSSCHVEGGEGKGAFAAVSTATAYNAFTFIGYERISQYAVNPSHKSPYTGTKNEASINLLDDQWIKGLENITACKNGATTPDPVIVDESTRLDTFSKAINLAADGATRTLTWNLTTELNDKNGAVTLPQVPGSTLSITVKRSILGARSVYEISSPTLKAGTTDVRLNSILVKLNGKRIANQTTFLYIDEGVRAGQTLRLAPGAMVVDGNISPLDVISLSIGQLMPVVLPPPPVQAKVSFVNAAESIPEKVNPAAVGSQSNYYSLQLRLDQPNVDQYVTATLGVMSTGYGAGLKAVNRRTTNTITLPNDTRDLSIDAWDWDFSVDTLAVVFAPGETTKTLLIKISNDDRREPNEQIRFNIVSVTNAIKDTVNQIVTVTIVDDDPVANPEIPTFASLMIPGGVLYQNCYYCHNSFDNRGGYNLSDYDLMINNKVLVPFDTASWMYRRMNETIPGLTTMPKDKLLDDASRRNVESWILNGAKND